MKCVAFLLAFFIFWSDTPEISEVRNAYRQASDSEAIAVQLHGDLVTVSRTSDPVLLAYKGAATTLMAKHATTIKEKKKYFKEGKDNLEYALAKDPNNIEIRFIRLSVQENAPKITGYRKNRNEDKAFLLEHLTKVKDRALKRYLKEFAAESTSFTSAEKEQVAGT